MAIRKFYVSLGTSSFSHIHRCQCSHLCRNQFRSVICIEREKRPKIVSFLRRYFAIIHPLRTKLTHTQTILIICSIWILSLLVSSPAIRSFSRVTYDCKIEDLDSHEKYRQLDVPIFLSWRNDVYLGSNGSFSR